MRRDTSAWNSNFSPLLRRDLFEIDSDSLKPYFERRYVNFYRWKHVSTILNIHEPLDNIRISGETMWNGADFFLNLWWIYDLVGITVGLGMKSRTWKPKHKRNITIKFSQFKPSSNLIQISPQTPKVKPSTIVIYVMQNAFSPHLNKEIKMAERRTKSHLHPAREREGKEGEEQRRSSTSSLFLQDFQ